ncbi:MAG: signal peptide peptidase SppA, partial [Bacteroidota bacterium]
SLSEEVNERTSANPFHNFDFGNMESHQQPGMNDILQCIDKAATDSRIKGIYIDASDVTTGMAQTEEIRNALLKFKKSGKFIYAYADAYSQNAYYLSSAATKVYVNPQGLVELHGLMTQLMFFKGTFEKLEIEPVLIRHGKFKSAGETFVLDKMSDENREQVAYFVNDIWNNIVSQIAASRGISNAEVENIADSLKVRTAYDAFKNKLVDRVAYFDEFITDINTVAGISSSKMETITASKYKDVAPEIKNKFTTDRIAVIYAEGEITGGEGDEKTIGAAKTADAIRKARFDNNVKAIVLRVNSPGGSALASEVIWREALLAGNSKPLIVSMSDLAASGGYYISCGAKKIFAQKNTITGSIGVFGLLLNAQNLLKNKLGITVDGYKTGLFTDLGLPTKPVTVAEQLIIQQSVDSIYQVFTQRVSDGRKINIATVDSLGQGRVWAGSSALKNNLVDTIGGLLDAISFAAKSAHLDNYRLKELPEQKEAFAELLSGLSGEASIWYEAKELGEQATYLRSMKKALRSQGVQMRLDYDINWKN